MATVNDKELEDLLAKCSAWMSKVMELVGWTAPVDMTSAMCKRAMKDTKYFRTLEQHCSLNRSMRCFRQRKMKQQKAERQ